eukprot:jgi/Mesen1/3981/ME000210S03216
MSDEDLRSRIKGYLKPGQGQEHTADEFLGLITYVSGPYEGRDGFAQLQEKMLSYERSVSGDEGPTRRLFYLALPPSVYPPVCKELRQYCMNSRGWTRVIVEKPFGKDLASAEKLSSELGELFTEDQLYRIDHYLGKEVVQNLLVMRFANRFFVPLWNRDNISNVQITFKEDFGTEGRGGYFDEYGCVLLFVVVTHPVLLRRVASLGGGLRGGAGSMGGEQVLNSMEAVRDKEVVLGQYDGYKDDDGVPDDSNTPTFAQVVLRINNERWDGVPFIVKAGKALDARKAEIRVQFRDTPGHIFQSYQDMGRNEFVMRLQPSEAMYMKLTVKKPGLQMEPTTSELDLSYKERYAGVAIPEAYERLILDTIRGDQQHFVRRDELKAAWEIFTPLLHRIDNRELKVTPYAQGGRGPEEADKLLERVGYKRTTGYVWRPPTIVVDKK